MCEWNGAVRVSAMLKETCACATNVELKGNGDVVINKCVIHSYQVYL